MLFYNGNIRLPDIVVPGTCFIHLKQQRFFHMLKKNFTLTWIIFSIIVACIATGLSYEDGLAYDGETVMGFPFMFYRHSAGADIITLQQKDIVTFNWLPLAIDIALAFGVSYVILRLLKRFRN